MRSSLNYLRRLRLAAHVKGTPMKISNEDLNAVERAAVAVNRRLQAARDALRRGDVKMAESALSEAQAQNWQTRRALLRTGAMDSIRADAAVPLPLACDVRSLRQLASAAHRGASDLLGTYSAQEILHMGRYVYISPGNTVLAGTPGDIWDSASNKAIASVPAMTTGTQNPTQLAAQTQIGQAIASSLNACGGAAVILTDQLLQRQADAITAYWAALSTIKSIAHGQPSDTPEVKSVKDQVRQAMANLQGPPK
jgi:hypothetical protein